MTATESRSRNPRGEGSRLRADIVAAAASILDETGDEQAVTLRAVARQIGIAAPSIYRHFADRQAILVALVGEAFAEFEQRLRDAAVAEDPVVRLRAVCDAYLEYARSRPQRYRVMFGGLWSAPDAVAAEAMTPDAAAELGQGALRVIAGTLQDCVTAGRSTSDDPLADAVALWLGLHGLAHQRAVSHAFPWPPAIVDRLVIPLAHLTP
ncbi:TetR/AcrR family transcriptional regulator [Winogradskya humida]|uniref:TetR/AcrR family transcriptional regulator n=1 Tax=Winogradskya humida TaxID=113566 RepID=UPI0019455D30|nr:TetR/AcrR family transcriptional regulator [Actinoplanes humidus]